MGVRLNCILWCVALTAFASVAHADIVRVTVSGVITETGNGSNFGGANSIPLTPESGYPITAYWDINTSAPNSSSQPGLYSADGLLDFGYTIDSQSVSFLNIVPSSSVDNDNGTYELSAVGSSSFQGTPLQVNLSLILSCTGTGSCPSGALPGSSSLYATNDSPLDLYTTVNETVDSVVEADISSLSISPAPVPVPAAAWLLLSGLGALGVLGRKRLAA